MISLRLYDRDGTTLLGLLPEPVSLQIGTEFNDVGAISFEYPAAGINASQIAEWREIAVINASGTEITNGRFVITNINRDRVTSEGIIAVSGKSILFRLDTALVYPTGGIASGELTRWFDVKTAGFVMKTLIDDAQTRAALPGLTYTFTATTDSNAAAWPDTLTQEYSARNTILSVLRGLQDFGIIEVETQARVLRATKADGIGVDRTTGSSPVVLRYGFNLTEAPEQVNADRLATTALIEGDGGLLVERTNSPATSTYGRIETALTASGIDDTASVNSLGDAYLSSASSADRQLTVGISLQDGTPQPFTDFNVGDYVYTATSAGLERVRVRQLNLSMSNGVYTASATLGDRIYETEIRNARKLAAISSGSVNLGNGSLIAPDVTIVADSVAPAAPTSLTGTTSAYLDAGRARAKVDLTWTAPTLNADGTALTDLRAYRVEYRPTVNDPFEDGGIWYSTNATVADLPLGVQRRFRVYAIDASNNQSVASGNFVITTSNYLEIPSVPSTPTLTTRLGTITVSWDGLTNGGAAMDIDLAYVEVHVSTTTGFNPSVSTLKGRLAPGKDFLVLSDLDYGTTYYVKLMARNTSGVNSGASAQASASVQRLVNTDIIDATLSGAKFLNGTIDTAQLANGSVSAAKIVDAAITGTKLSADAVTADKIAAGAIGADEIAANAIVAGKIAANAVTAGTVAALAISAGNIQSNAITTDKIDAGAITAVKIAANAITADKIQAGAITTDKLTAGTLTGFTITNGSNFTVTSTGTMTAVAGTIGGFTIANGQLGDGAGTYISTGGAAAFGGLVTLRGTSTTLNFSNGGNITMGGGNITGAGTISGTTISGAVSATTLSVSSTSTYTGLATFNGTATFNSTMFAPNLTTSTSATNLRVATGTIGEISETSASSERFKENIVDLSIVPELDAKKLLQIPVRAFSYKADYLSESDDRSGAMLPGFIAEEVDAIYPIAADYAEGQPHSWNERFMIPGLLALIQDLYKEIELLKGAE